VAPYVLASARRTVPLADRLGSQEAGGATVYSVGDVRQPVVGAVAGVVACATMLETAEAAAGVTTRSRFVREGTCSVVLTGRAPSGDAGGSGAGGGLEWTSTAHVAAVVATALPSKPRIRYRLNLISVPRPALFIRTPPTGHGIELGREGYRDQAAVSPAHRRRASAVARSPWSMGSG
jgi:hypothetical protein